MSIEDYRAEIDAIDDELLRLMNIRAQLAVKVGALKNAASLPICDPERELEILARVCHTNAGPLDESAVRRLFHLIIHESRFIEAKLNVSCHNTNEKGGKRATT